MHARQHILPTTTNSDHAIGRLVRVLQVESRRWIQTGHARVASSYLMGRGEGRGAE